MHLRKLHDVQLNADAPKFIPTNPIIPPTNPNYNANNVEEDNREAFTEQQITYAEPVNSSDTPDSDVHPNTNGRNSPISASTIPPIRRSSRVKRGVDRFADRYDEYYE